MPAQDILSAIKQKADIVHVAIQCGLKVRENGDGQFIAPCPFHEESQSSFRIYAKQNRFYCFGCKASGDVIDLYQKMKGLSVTEAMADLATNYGINLSPKSEYKPTQAEIEAREYRTSTWIAANHYSKMFWMEGNVGYQYMSKRGIDDATLKEFCVGYAPESNAGLLAALHGKQIADEKALSFGLLARSKQGNLFDPFFGRVMFPVQMPGLGTVAFGGRDISGKSDAKYRNSSGNTFFHKGSVLYGLTQAAPAIRRLDSAIVVEGYIDVLAMHQHGLKNCVGSMGTAVTHSQLETLREYTGNLTVLMDGDASGQKAAVKAVKSAIEKGFNVIVVFLDGDHDPDTFLRAFGPEKLKELLGNGRKGLSFLLDCLEEESPSVLADWIRVYVNGIEDKLIAVVLAKKIATHLGVKAQTLLDSIGFQILCPQSDEEERDSLSAVQQ